MGIEMDDRDSFLAVNVGECGHVGVFERVIATDNERDRASRRDFANDFAYVLHRTFSTVVVDRDIAVIHDVQLTTRIDHRVLIRPTHVPAVQAQIRRRLAARIAPARSHVQRRTEDRNVDFRGDQVFHRQCKGVATKSRRTAGAIVATKRNGARLSCRIHGSWTNGSPGVEFGGAGIEWNIRQVATFDISIGCVHIHHCADPGFHLFRRAFLQRLDRVVGSAGIAPRIPALQEHDFFIRQ